MKKGIGWTLWISSLLIIAVAASNLTALAQDRMTGFSTRRAEAQREIERRLASLPSAEEARAHHRFFTAEPHPAGSERNNELARHMAEVWKRQGWEDVRIHRYDVLDSHPREVSLEMISPVRHRASLREEAYAVDPDTGNKNVRTGYTGFSASGEVIAPLVRAQRQPRRL
jgi:N-acetylated-alpha-linked acidic dipeptidase